MPPAIPQSQTATANARASPVNVTDPHRAPAASRDASVSDASSMHSAPAPPAPAAAKKGKDKKANDPDDASKQLAARIAQLEQDKVKSQEQDAEVEREVRKANRDLVNLLNNLETPLQKLELVRKRYSDLYRKMKEHERDHQREKRRADQLQREKDTAKSELSKATSAETKTNNMYRKLMNDHKKLKDDHEKLQDTESKAREELNDRLQKMALEVQEVVTQREVPEVQPAQEMEIEKIFREKFKSFIEQYELREIQFQSLLRTKELEIQYQMARFEQQRKAQEIETSKSNQLTRQVSTFSQTETELRSQLNIYVEKFKQGIIRQVEDTLNNSNDLFLTFRKEMEEMSKKTKRLEKENYQLTRKQKTTGENVLKMAEERAKQDKEIRTLQKKNERLEQLCRGMQAQGRGSMPSANQQAGAGGTAPSYGPEDVMGFEGEGDADEGATDSEYDEYEDDEDVGSEEYDEDTEEEALHATVNGPKTYGPVPPPPPPPTVAGTGKGQANGQLNGQKGTARKSVGW
ncbi:MAG: hypothetical protein M1821_001105 [Bathelium mastoideum]|nr:MAG: hypothetical protein M1821_001105 [Bathelium mastoideum]KAI9693867.1 MAG: hypothetical protein M1822_003138 [Bathelium mastoideum]